ncbi:MAG: HAD family hydrolase [Oscillospiraceae bacterium]
MSCDTVVFDLDGTLLDTLDDLCDSLNHVLLTHALPAQTRDEVMSHVGNGSARLVELSLQNGREHPLFDEVLRDYGAWYAAHCRLRTAPYPGISALLRRLSAEGIRCAVVSNKPDGAVKSLCADFFPGLLSAAIGERPGIKRKPAPDTLLSAMAELKALPSRTVYVGDSEVDIATAKNAGVRCVSVLWGFRTARQLTAAGATAAASDTHELYSLLLG